MLRGIRKEWLNMAFEQRTEHGRRPGCQVYLGSTFVSMQGCDGSAHYSGGVLESILTLVEAFVREGRGEVEVVTRISPVFLKTGRRVFFVLG